MKKIVIVGSGGREHALAQHFLRYQRDIQIYIYPGNPGMTLTEPIFLVSSPSGQNPLSYLVDFCLHKKIDFVFVSPDNALAEGWVDELKKNGILTFGPTQKASQLESSKIFSKQLLMDLKIPTASAKFVTNPQELKEALEGDHWSQGIVVKADELAFGKGVFLCDKKEEAYQTGLNLLQGAIGNFGKKILIEKKIEGPEVSLFYLCQGEEFCYLGSACDYKRLTEDINSPNTGGMGAHSVTEEEENKYLPLVEKNIIKPVLKEMLQRQTPFEGILFVGCMLTQEGPQVLEFNVRWGDPEAQCLLPLIDFDLLNLFIQLSKEKVQLSKIKIPRKKLNSIHVVKVTQGYSLQKNLPLGNPVILRNLKIDDKENVFLTYAGVGKNERDELVNSGGRVLGLTCLASTRDSAREKVYSQLQNITFKDEYYRKDIGCRKL